MLVHVEVFPSTNKFQRPTYNIFYKFWRFIVILSVRTDRSISVGSWHIFTIIPSHFGSIRTISTVRQILARPRRLSRQTCFTLYLAGSILKQFSNLIMFGVGRLFKSPHQLQPAPTHNLHKWFVALGRTNCLLSLTAVAGTNKTEIRYGNGFR